MLLGLLGPILGFWAAIVVLGAAGTNPWSLGLTDVLLLLGYLSLRLTGGKRHTWRPMRLALLLGLLLNLYLLYGLPWPPSPFEISTTALLLFTAVASALAALSATRYPRLVLLLVAVLASWGLVVAVRLVVAFSSGAGVATSYQPSLALPLVLGNALAMAWLGALFLASILRRRPSARSADAT
ncbi:MAG: hypothetical protein IPI92_12205 [Gemmatimonadetes bacterium]|nr:hypothetical protein [Gemmatimonadota bacterium]MBK7785769.1 hypothetical protein [Gemmatimonadota bacterium]MBK9067109.1 hypothetical protein [Gemmatimonadota bacterium]